MSHPNTPGAEAPGAHGAARRHLAWHRTGDTKPWRLVDSMGPVDMMGLELYMFVK